MRFELGIARFGVQHFTSGLPVSAQLTHEHHSGVKYCYIPVFKTYLPDTTPVKHKCREPGY